MTHTMRECVIEVLNSPESVADVLDVVRRALNDGRLDEGRFAVVRRQLQALVGATAVRT